MMMDLRDQNSLVVHEIRQWLQRRWLFSFRSLTWIWKVPHSTGLAHIALNHLQLYMFTCCFGYCTSEQVKVPPGGVATGYSGLISSLAIPCLRPSWPFATEQSRPSPYSTVSRPGCDSKQNPQQQGAEKLGEINHEPRPWQLTSPWICFRQFVGSTCQR